MHEGRKVPFAAAWLFASVVAFAMVPGLTAVGAQTPTAQASTAARPVGTIKAVSGNNITLTTDAGSEVKVVVQDAARLLRVEPGQKDLKEAAPLQLQDLLPGDRILVRGQLADDGKTVLATSVIAMKKADIAQKQAHEREEWQRNGIGGVVTGVDAGAGTISVSLPALGEKKEVAVHVSKDTVLRRYSPDSVKFDDAKPAPIDQIKAGDQLRARGTRSEDGNELTAVEVVSGTFRNIAGTVSSVDAAANSITLQDLATKKSVTVKITGDSLVRKLPLPMAQGIAARLKGGASGAAAPVGASAAAGTNSSAAVGTGQAGPLAGGPGAGGAARGGSGGGRGDFQQALSRMPPATLAEFQKGDAVMLVATEGGPNGMPSVITLLGGVEPILTASPSSSASSILSPWSLGGAPGGEGNP